MGAERRILMLAPFPPRLDATHGGSRAIANLVVTLGKRNRVTLGYLRAGDEPEIDPEVAAACERIHESARPGLSTSSVRPWPRAFGVLPPLAAGKPLWVAARWSRAFAGWVSRFADEWQPHVVQAEYSAMGQYLSFARGSGARHVVTFYDPGVPVARERLVSSAPTARAFWSLDLRLWIRFERALLRRADASVVLTGRDRAAMASLEPAARPHQIPLGVRLPPTPRGRPGREPESLLFVGNLFHPPNLDAVVRLMTSIFPALRRRHPHLRLRVVGDGVPARVREMASEGVIVTGRVARVDPYLEGASVVVAPIRLGGGMRMKVLEALAAGKALVASSLAVEGLDLLHGVEAVVVESDPEFVEAVSGLIADPERRARLGEAGRARVAASFTPDRTAEAYEGLYDGLLRTPRSAGTGGRTA